MSGYSRHVGLFSFMLLLHVRVALSFAPDTKAALETAVSAWLSDASAAEATYGHISTWDTSAITDMSSLFCDSDGDWSSGCSYSNSVASDFNDDISTWDTSSVTTMELMLNGASSFNHNIGSWDTSSVTSMASMFD